MPKNNAKRWAISSLIIMIFGIFMVIAGIIIEDYNFYWMIYIGFILGLTCFICLIVFISQARRLDKLFKNIDLLAHWTFNSTTEHLEKAKAEYLERKKRSKSLLITMTVFFVVIGGFFLLFGFDDFDEALIFFLFFFGVLALLYIVGLTIPKVAYNHMIKSPPEVFVGPYSAWVMGEYVQWKAPMTQIIQVNLAQIEKGVVIEVYYSTLQRYGEQENVCRIPVPIGKEEEANTVAQNIASLNNVEYHTFQ